MNSFKEFLTEQSMLLEALIQLNNGKKYGQVLFLAGGAGCFSANTLVHTSNGNIPISQASPGDKVLSFNEITQENEFNDIEEVITYPIDNFFENILEINFEDGSKVICSENHEFLIDGNWIKAKDL